MNKICILQISNNNDELTNLSKQINKKYAELNNFDYKFETFETNILFIDAVKYKFLNILKYINNYDYICYIDIDAAFSNPNRKIDELIDKKFDVFIAQDSGIVGNTIFPLQITQIIQNCLNQYKINYIFDFNHFCNEVNKQLNFNILSKFGTIFSNPNGLNTGLMIFKNSEISKSLINDVLKYIDLFENIKHDQDCISLLLQKPKYNQFLKILPLETQGNSALVQQPEFYYNEDKSFINHIYGWPLKEKILGLNLVKNNKWWKSIFKNNNEKSFLILQTETALGDTLVTTNFFKDFHNQYPNYKIYYKVDSNVPYVVNQKIEIFKNNPNVKIFNGEQIDKIIKYNCGKFLEDSKKSNNIMNHSLYEIFKEETGINVKQNTFYTDVYLTNEEQSDSILNRFNIPKNKPICLICAGYHPLINTVKYIGTKKLQHIVNELHEKITFVQIGDTGNGYKQNILNHTINLINKTNIRDLFSLAYQSRFIITGLHALLIIASINSKIQRDIYVFQGCRENLFWHSSYFKLDNIKYHILGYDIKKFEKCLKGDKCCLKDVTVPSNYGYKLCNYTKKIDDEIISECMNNIDENEIIIDINQKLN